MDKTIRKLLEAISELMTNRSGSWKDLRNAILAEATEAEKIDLLEFVAWFEEIEDAE